MTYDELLVALESVPLLEAREMMRKGERHFQKKINEEHDKKQRAIYESVPKKTILEGPKVVAAICQSGNRVFEITPVSKVNFFGDSPDGYQVTEHLESGACSRIISNHRRFFNLVISIAKYNAEVPQ